SSGQRGRIPGTLHVGRKGRHRRRPGARMSKPEIEFTRVEDTAWTACSGSVRGLQERILARDPVSGVASRMLRFAPGTDTTPNGVVVHDFWEEVYILEGSLH